MALYTETKFMTAVDKVRWHAVMMDQARQANDAKAYVEAMASFALAKQVLEGFITEGLDLSFDWPAPVVEAPPAPLVDELEQLPTPPIAIETPDPTHPKPAPGTVVTFDPTVIEPGATKTESER